MGSRQEHLNSIANTIADYEQCRISPEHVNRWVSQFDVADQQIILEEIDQILYLTYASRVYIKTHLRNFIHNKVIGQQPTSILAQTNFLANQTDGNSQQTLLNIANEILEEDFGISVTQCGQHNANTFIYLDDAIFTGNRIKYDLAVPLNDSPAWIPNSAPDTGKVLYIWTVASHSAGLAYVRQIIEDAARRKNLNVEFFSQRKFLNKKNNGVYYDCLWPSIQEYGQDVMEYVEGLASQRNMNVNELFRTSNVFTDRLFSSIQARDIVERAFLRKGVMLATSGVYRADSMRPLGFEKLVSLGLGTFFVTYRNIANNCPLVLWWGDPSYTPTHPLGRWYPLFYRRTNNSVV